MDRATPASSEAEYRNIALEQAHRDCVRPAGGVPDSEDLQDPVGRDDLEGFGLVCREDVAQRGRIDVSRAGAEQLKEGIVE
eukprot:11219011-Lingulodinium_polyedra.AAC.1